MITSFIIKINYKSNQIMSMFLKLITFIKDEYSQNIPKVFTGEKKKMLNSLNLVVTPYLGFDTLA